jgi:hypothetical protein
MTVTPPFAEQGKGDILNGWRYFPAPELDDSGEKYDQ